MFSFFRGSETNHYKPACIIVFALILLFPGGTYRGSASFPGWNMCGFILENSRARDAPSPTLQKQQVQRARQTGPPPAAGQPVALPL